MDEDDGGDVIVGPPRPPGLGTDGGVEDVDDDDVMVGPPRPPVDLDRSRDDDGEMIGPPRPPPAGSKLSDSEEEDMDDEEDNRHRIPLSNEIVLKGHTKVLSSSLQLLCCFYNLEKIFTLFFLLDMCAFFV